MSKQLNVLFISSEVAPFAKTGGLADVAGALPKELKDLGHDVRVILPKYSMVDERKFNLREVIRLKDIEIRMGEDRYSVAFKSAFLPDSRVQVYFMEYDPFFDRDSLYLDPKTGVDWEDNPQRFTLLCRATLAALKLLHWQPDIIHCNDWQTALIPYLLKSEMVGDPFFQKTRTLLSIHNLAYQGNFDPEMMDAIGLKQGMVIGEIGAGRGRYAVSLAERVGEKGKVYANDISKKDLDYLDHRCKRDNINNIETILGEEIEPKFPENTLDIAFIINTYHHLEKPTALLKNVVPALKPDGILAIVEHEPKKSGYSLQSSTTKETLIRQVSDAGFRLDRIETFLERDNIYIFKLK